MRIFIISLIAFFTFVIFACDQKAEQNESNVIFNVDSTLLAKQYEIQDFKLSIKPPKSLNLLPEEFIVEIGKRLNTSIGDSANFTIQPILIFTDSLNDFSCSVSQIIHPNEEILQTFLELNYIPFLNRSFTNANIKTGNYTIDSLNITQYLIMTKDKVIFKLIFISQNNMTIQIDYAIAQSIYPNHIEQIESSIGSISTFN